jgi:hypothetical protein
MLTQKRLIKISDMQLIYRSAKLIFVFFLLSIVHACMICSNEPSFVEVQAHSFVIADEYSRNGLILSDTAKEGKIPSYAVKNFGFTLFFLDTTGLRYLSANENANFFSRAMACEEPPIYVIQADTIAQIKISGIQNLDTTDLTKNFATPLESGFLGRISELDKMNLNSNGLLNESLSDLPDSIGYYGHYTLGHLELSYMDEQPLGQLKFLIEIELTNGYRMQKETQEILVTNLD